MSRRPDLETRLDGLPGVTWRYERALPVDEIDLPSSASLQYRLTDVDQATVDRYAADMARGDRFPALIVRDVRGRHTLVGGNHRRAAAAQAGIGTHAAYIIGCTPAQARQLAYDDNRTHGLPLRPAERAVLGARLVLLDRMPRDEAAATVGATVAQIAQAVTAERQTTRAAELGLPAAYAELSVYSRAAMAGIGDDGLFAEAARTVLATNMGGGTVQQLCQRINSAPTVDDAYDRIDAIAAARAGAVGGRGVKKSPLNYLTDHALGLLDVDPERAAALVAAGDEQIWRDRLQRAARHLMAVDRAIAARQEDTP